jgi:hypothetical protein
LLTAGDQISIPTKPPLKPGAPTGLLVGTLTGDYRSAKNPVVLFNGHGRLLATFKVPSVPPFRLRLSPGRYLLLPDDGLEFGCLAARVRVRAGEVAHVAVPFGCDSSN